MSDWEQANGEPRVRSLFEQGAVVADLPRHPAPSPLLADVPMPAGNPGVAEPHSRVRSRNGHEDGSTVCEKEHELVADKGLELRGHVLSGPT